MCDAEHRSLERVLLIPLIAIASQFKLLWNLPSSSTDQVGKSSSVCLLLGWMTASDISPESILCCRSRL